ncbi:expressed unknown protein [Seminavis robusta]|uniref:Uncharacterized protein n=1 Tax=Seminavis robusta TaxID=568900 RepID=A0A9N8HSM1_9STRA|nr:expressed unknown protein [Seminavis robusta]|eukprot:Sro1403_g269620.1 n/a (201) ;mRNA; r:1693-2295
MIMRKSRSGNRLASHDAQRKAWDFGEMMNDDSLTSWADHSDSSLTFNSSTSSFSSPKPSPRLIRQQRMSVATDMLKRSIHSFDRLILDASSSSLLGNLSNDYLEGGEEQQHEHEEEDAAQRATVAEQVAREELPVIVVRSNCGIASRRRRTSQGNKGGDPMSNSSSSRRRSRRREGSGKSRRRSDQPQTHLELQIPDMYT